MEEIIKTTLLEYDKSSFLIDLVKHKGGAVYIKITQTIQQKSGIPLQTELKINPSLLDDILEVLSAYEREIPAKQLDRKGALTKENKKSIENRYLKGVSIKDIALQFNCAKELIEQILTNRNIVIVPESFTTTKIQPAKSTKQELKDRHKKMYKKTITGRDVKLNDGSLLSELIKVRRAIALREKLPPYVIFSNDTLQDMASYMPISIERLIFIKGIGEGKANRFGTEFLETIKDWVEKSERKKSKKK